MVIWRFITIETIEQYRLQNGYHNKAAMENFEISVNYKNENHHFVVKDYMHHEGDQCKFEVFSNDQFIAGFEPGPHKHLHICKNTGLLPEEILNLVADSIEAMHL